MTDEATGAAFERLEAALRQADAAMGAAEAHGRLCGLMCVSEPPDRRAWLGAVFGPTEAPGTAVADCTRELATLYSESERQFRDEHFDFHPVLPSDDLPLPERARQLGYWCRGFVAGLEAGGVTLAGEIPDNVAEVLVDLTEISQIEVEPDASSEEEEAAYVEVEEYVRMAVLLAREELRAGPEPGARLH